MIKLAWFSASIWCLFFISCIAGERSNAVGNTAVISLDLQAVEVSKALQLLAKLNQFNVVLDESVQGKVSLHLHQVPAEEALQSILELQGLTQRRKGNTRIIRHKQAITHSPPVASKTSLTTQRIHIQHRMAKDIAKRFLDSQLTKTTGSDLRIDVASNSLWIRDTPDRIQALQHLVTLEDRAVQQVLIEARIVSINRNVDRTLGIRCHLKPLSVEANRVNDSTVKTNESDADATSLPLTLDLPNFSRPLHTLWLPLWRGVNRLLDLELAAIENEGNGRIIASPHLMTTNGTPALIEAGSEVPYQEKSRYGTSVAFKKAVLSLQVTPEVKPAGKILLKLDVHHDKPGAPSIEKTATIDTQHLKTEVIVQSSETVALGGIYETVEQQGRYSIPGLGSLPIVGWLFSHRARIQTTRELLVFVTPHLVSEELLAERKASQTS